MSTKTSFFLSQEDLDRIRTRYAKFNQPWQQCEVDELKAMSADNVSIPEMADQLQRTPNSIRMKLKALDLYTPKPAARAWAEDEECQLTDMYNSGVSFDEMSERLNRSKRAIVSRLVLLRMNLFN